MQRARLRAHPLGRDRPLETVSRGAVDAADRERLQDLGADARVQVERAQQRGHRVGGDPVRVPEPRPVLRDVAAGRQAELADHLAQQAHALVAGRRAAVHLGAGRLEHALRVVVVGVLVDLAQQDAERRRFVHREQRQHVARLLRRRRRDARVVAHRDPGRLQRRAHQRRRVQRLVRHAPAKDDAAAARRHAPGHVDLDARAVDGQAHRHARAPSSPS